MDHDTDGDGAINLSTSQRPSAATTPNGDTPSYGQDQQDNDQVHRWLILRNFTPDKIARDTSPSCYSLARAKWPRYDIFQRNRVNAPL